MPDTTTEQPQKTGRKGPTKGYRNPTSVKVQPKKHYPIDSEMIPLREALPLLRHLPGYHSYASMRLRIIVDKELPFQRVGKGKRSRIWVHGPSIHEMIGKHKNEFPIPMPAPIVSEDQKLIKHFRESKKNNYITAVEAGLASTLAHAKHVYEEYLKAVNDPILLAIEASEAREAQLAKPETRCKTCDRTEQLAKEDDTRVVHEVTSGRDMLEMIEESALSEYQSFRCKECWYWRPHAPIARMCEHLLKSSPIPPTLPEAPEQTTPKTA